MATKKLHVRYKGMVEGTELLSAKEYADQQAAACRVAVRKTARDFGKSIERAMERAAKRARRGE